MSDDLQTYADHGLVIFCGAGVSMVPPTCLPSWWQMNEEVVLTLAGQVEKFIGAEQAADLAKQINERRDNRHFPPEYQAEIISKRFGTSYFKVLECLDGDEPNAVHLAIASLAKKGYVRAIVTSNFDRLLETAFRKLDVPLEIHYKADHFEKLAGDYENAAQPRPTCDLLKLHGSVEDHSTLVDTLAQRMRGLAPAINSCLRYLLHYYHWLFLGYSGADLEARPQYLCLQAEAPNAVGITWLVRETAKNEPNEAVTKVLNLYGDRASTPRGELPDWFFHQFGSLLPSDLAIPSLLDQQELEQRKRQAAQGIIAHTREWGKTLGGVRAAQVLADMLSHVVGNPQAAQRLLARVLAAEGMADSAFVAVANSLANILNDLGKSDAAIDTAKAAQARIPVENERDRTGILITLGLILQKRGDYQSALAHFERVYEYSSRVNDEDLKGIALHNQAWALTSLGRYAKAQSYYEEELEIVRRQGDAIAQAQTLNNIGDLLRRQNQYEESIRALNESISLRERLGDMNGVAYCLGNIASAHQERGDYPKAKEIYEQVLAIFQRVEDQGGVVTTLCNLGTIARDMGDLEEAENVFQQAAKIAAEHQIETGRARSLYGLGSIYREARRFEEANQLYEEARMIYRKADDPDGEANVLNELGILLWRCGQLDEAAETFKQAMTIFGNLNQQSGRAQALGNLALVVMDQGDLAQALRLLQEELSITDRLQLKYQMANTLSNIGVVQFRQNAIEESLESLNSAQRIYQDIGAGGQAARVLALIGEFHGSQGKISESLRWFDQSIPLASSVEDRTEISERLINILQLVLENNRGDIASLFIQRLEALGVQIKIETDSNTDLNPNH